MALRVWLPLNGNIENKGLSDACKGEGALTYGDGKIGKALYMETASTANGIYAPKQERQVYTVALWFKAPGYTGTRRDLCNEGRDYNTYGWRVGLSANENTLTIVGASSGGTYTQSFIPDTWYHIAFSRDESKNVYIYINGVLVSTKTGTGDLNYSESNGYINIGRFCHGSGNSKLYPYQGYLNDFRYYDECLSQKQIKEISKGLIAHYKLDTARTLNNLKRNASYSSYNNFSSAGATCTVVKTGEKFNGADVWRMIYTPVESNLSHVQTTLHGHGVYTASATYKANTKYCYWTLCKLISHPDTIVGGTASNIGGWTEIPMKKYNKDWYVVGQYRSGAITVDKSDSIFTSFKTPSATAGTPIIIDFCCPHLVEGYDYIVPEFDYAGNTPPYEPDDSGYGYNGTVAGALSYSADSPRYEGSTKFSNGSYINIHDILNIDAKQISFSFWFNMDGASQNLYSAIFIPLNNPTGSEGIWLSINTESVGLWAYRAGHTPNYHKAGSLIGTSGWHYAVFVWDAGVTKWYLDGAQYGSTVDTWNTDSLTCTRDFSIGDSYTGTSWSGTPFTGRLSDFRIYATALSANEILTMYKNSGIIDNKGNVYAYEFKEE